MRQSYWDHGVLTPLSTIFQLTSFLFTTLRRGHRGGDPMVVGFMTTYGISDYHH
jgi:hypothetical protein